MPRLSSIQNRGDQQRAFTRTDLLALIIAAALLFLLQVSSFAAGKHAGHTSVCLNNVKQLMRGWTGYSEDHNGWFPMNALDAGSNYWVRGNMSVVADTTNVAFLADSQVAPYIDRNFRLFRCPDDPSKTRSVPRVRSYSANEAVGTKADGQTPVDGLWLNGTFGSNTHNGPWRTYGKLPDMVAPKPSGLWVIADEDEYSINDAGFAVSMVGSQMIDWPATRHGFRGTFSFADGHGEIHHWVDPRTKVLKGNVTRQFQPNNADIVWIQQRTSARAN